VKKDGTKRPDAGPLRPGNSGKFDQLKTGKVNLKQANQAANRANNRKVGRVTRPR
jgi:hypothetical protein